MSTVLDHAQKQIRNRHADAMSAYRAILQRQVTGEAREGDADALAQAAKDIGIDPADFAADCRAVARVRAARAKMVAKDEKSAMAAEITHLRAEHKKAHRALAEAAAKWQAEEQKLRTAADSANMTWLRAQAITDSAERQIREIERQHVRVFGPAPADQQTAKEQTVEERYGAAIRAARGGERDAMACELGLTEEEVRLDQLAYWQATKLASVQAGRDELGAASARAQAAREQAAAQHPAGTKIDKLPEISSLLVAEWQIRNRLASVAEACPNAPADEQGIAAAIDKIRDANPRAFIGA